MTLLKVSSVSKQGEGGFELQNISFSQKKNQKIAVSGETGSGKSTLLKIIGGLEQQDSGDVHFRNELVRGPSENLVPGHPSIAYLSQNFELPKSLRVEQVLAYANTLTDDEANTLFEVCQISHLVKRRTDQLSGGERQRIAMARLLISSPSLLLLDEPFTHLDVPHKNTLKAVIHDIGERLKISCILVSHDPGDTLSWADVILVMKEGKVIQKGTPEKIYHQPVNEYTAGLFGNYNVITPEVARLFFNLRKLKTTRKKMIARPHAINVVTKAKSKTSGKVRAVHFFGSYCELEVVLDGHVLTVRTRQPVKLNKTVYLALSAEQLWYV
jgi:ABC-type sulfate/molybdate transport systems ATPase subunit